MSEETLTALPLPVYLDVEPLIETATCPTCGQKARAEVRFVATYYVGERLTRETARGVWEPAIYECPLGHIAMESEV